MTELGKVVAKGISKMNFDNTLGKLRIPIVGQGLYLPAIMGETKWRLVELIEEYRKYKGIKPFRILSGKDRVVRKGLFSLKKRNLIKKVDIGIYKLTDDGIKLGKVLHLLLSRNPI